MSVLVILEMDGDPDALLAAAAELEARRPTSAIKARVGCESATATTASSSALSQSRSFRPLTSTFPTPATS